MRLAVKVVPRAADSRVVGWLGDRLKVRLRAAPERGAANRELVTLLARRLRCPESAIRIVAGAGSASKLVEIDGLERGELERRLGVE